MSKTTIPTSQTTINHYLLTNEFIMKLMAMWPITITKSNYTRTILNIIYAIIITILSIQLSLTCILDLIINSNGELIKITEGLINSLLYIVGTIQILYFHIRGKHLLILIQQLNRTFRYTSAQSLENVTMFNSYEYAKKLTIHWSWICVVSALGWMLNPFLVDSPDGKRLIPLKSWYPFDYQKSPNYEFVYCLQGVGQIILGSAFGNLDCMFMTMVILTSGQYKLLRTSLKNVRYTAMLKCGILKEDIHQFANYFNQYGFGESIDLKSKNRSEFAQRQWNYYTLDGGLLEGRLSYTRIFDKELDEAIKDCVKHHQDILEFCKLMEWFFSPIILIKMVYGTVFLCLLAYSATSTVDVDFMKLENYVQYLFLALVEIFLYAYFSNILTDESVSIRNAIYECPWYICNRRFNTSIQLILMRCNRPVIITGGKFFHLSVQTYTSIVKTAFSYFTMLQTINDKH